MNSLLVPALYGLAGICVYAALQHLLTTYRRSDTRAHFWFGLQCLAIAGYVLAKAGAYQADSAREVVYFRHWEATTAMVFFVLFAWFVREYSGQRQLWAPVGLSLLLTVVAVANQLLDHGANFARLPEFRYLVLPWGERVADLRVNDPTVWHHVGWLGMVLVFAYGLYAGWQQFRQGRRRRGGTLFAAVSVFLGFLLINKLVNLGIIRFTHTAEFGFLAMLFLMGQGLTRELRDADRRLKAILDHVPAIVYLKHADGRYLFVNRQFEGIFQLESADVAGKRDSDLFPADQAGAFRARDLAVLEGGKALRGEETIETGGQPRQYLAFRFPVADADDGPYAVCGVSTDITESRKAERELEALRRQVLRADRVGRIGVVSSSLAHELTQPLTAIQTNAEVGQRHLSGEGGATDLDELRAIFEDILRDAERAGAVIVGLRAMLRPEDAAREPVRLGETIDGALKLMQADMVNGGIECRRAMDPGCMVRADKVQIGQVILNLVMNALDAMAGRPAGERCLEISVSAGQDGAAHVAVQDSGIGWPEGRLERIFEGFYTTKNEGLGMGLALSRSIIESHGGRIWAEGEPGRGASVHFTLPLTTGEEA